MVNMSTPSSSCLLDLSETFVLGSGTIPIDPFKKVVLLLFYRPKGAFILPKGQKNMDEAFEAAAVRGTMEKTGYECHLFKTKQQTQGASFGHPLHCTTPIAIQQKFREGIRRLVFWYVTQVDSTDACISDRQEMGEDFTVCWVGTDLAPAMMTFEEEKKIVARAVDAFSA